MRKGLGIFLSVVPKTILLFLSGNISPAWHCHFVLLAGAITS